MEARPTFEFPWVLLYKNNKTVGGLDKKQLTKVRETLPAPEVEAEVVLRQVSTALRCERSNLLLVL